jgi:hypothetical protein
MKIPTVKVTTIICAVAVLAALVFIVYTFMIEGFITTMEDARATGYMKANSDTICMAFGDGTNGDCAKCLDPDDVHHFGTDCGYWPQGKACIPRSGIYRLVPDWVTQKQNADKAYPQVFDPKDFVYNIGKCGGAACASFKTCKACAGASSCGWCDTNNTCMDRTAVSANVDAIARAGSLGSMGSAPQPMCPAQGSSGQPAITSASMVSSESSSKVLIQEIGTCRPETCADKKGCFECTTTSGCGFCKTTGQCIKVNSGGAQEAAIQDGGSTGPSGSAVCPTGSILLQQYMCPCSSMTDCKTCSTQPGCGWCVGGKNCVNIDVTSKSGDSENIVGGVNIRDCAAGGDGVATSASQCAPGAKLGNVRSAKTSTYRASEDELNRIQDNTALGEGDPERQLDLRGSVGPGVIGAGPVSAAKTSEVTGNGVVPIPRSSGGPYTFTNQPNLFTSPFEEYVKVLIRSEMANGGMPTNEPFQDTSPNIVNYLTKEVNRVVRKNF